MRIPRKALAAIALLATATGFAVPAAPAFAYSGGYAKYEEVTWLRGSSHNEASIIAGDYVTASGYYTVGSELLPLF